MESELHPSECLDAKRILDILPHRYPFLLVDRVVSYNQEGELTAVKNVTVNEPFFTGHFPGDPLMPGVLIVEAMAQASALCASVFRFEGSSYGEKNGQSVYLLGIDKCRFKRGVVPGDVLHITVREAKYKQGIGFYDGVAKVNDAVVASATVMCTMRKREV